MTMVSVPLDLLESLPHFQEALIRADRATVVGSLARGMAHDLRGPLQTLNLLVDPHLDCLGQGEGARFRTAMTDSVQQLANSITRLSQVFAPPEIEAAPVILADLLTSVVDLQGYQRGLQAAHLDLRLAAGLPPVRGLEGSLRHVLFSLLINAKEALAEREDARIAIEACSEREMVRLTVEDNGGGLLAEARSRAFEPFFSTRRENLGLGLSVARLLVSRQGGSIDLQDGAYGGTRAVLLLPVWHRP